MAAALSKIQLFPEHRYKKDWKKGEKILLTVTENHPRFGDGTPVSRRLDRYFEALARHWRHRWEGSLLRQALAADPEQPWSAALDFHLTRMDKQYLSLWWEARESTGDPQPRRMREGEIWRMSDGTPLTLPRLLGQKSWRRRVLEQVSCQIRTQLEAGEALYYEDWPRLCRRQLSPHRCYLAEEGPVVFFPICSIAPALEDFPTFPLAAPE